jgi:hypothetical protein
MWSHVMWRALYGLCTVALVETLFTFKKISLHKNIFLQMYQTLGLDLASATTKSRQILVKNKKGIEIITKTSNLFYQDIVHKTQNLQQILSVNIVKFPLKCGKHSAL